LRLSIFNNFLDISTNLILLLRNKLTSSSLALTIAVSYKELIFFNLFNILMEGYLNFDILDNLRLFKQ